MNGISSNLKDEIKKSRESKHKEKFKFIAAVLVTNIMVAILCLPGENSPTEEKIKNKTKTLHAGYQMMTLPLTVLVTTTDESAHETPVTLVSKDKKIIVEKAWLHELVKTEGDIPQFKIEISSDDVVHMSEFVNEGVVAVPYVQKKIKLSLKKRGSKYEVSI